MKSAIRKYSVWALCLYFVTGMASGIHGSVVCIDANDSVRVETVCEPCCDEAERSCEATDPGSEQAVHAGCLDCTDIPLILETLLGRNSGHVAAHYIVTAAPVVTSLHAVAPEFDSLGRFESRGIAPPVSISASISTTVLLC